MALTMLTVPISSSEYEVFCYIKNIKNFSGQDEVQNVPRDKPEFTAAVFAYIPSNCSQEEFQKIKKEHRFCIATFEKEQGASIEKITSLFVHPDWQKRFAERRVTALVHSLMRDSVEELRFNENDTQCEIFTEEEFNHQVSECEKTLNKLNPGRTNLLSRLMTRFSGK